MPKKNTTLRGKEKIKDGRPTSYNDKYCNEIIRLRYQGKTLPEIAHKWCVSISTIKGWKNPHSNSYVEDFATAYARARIAHHAWFAKWVRKQIEKPKVNDRLIKYYGRYFLGIGDDSRDDKEEVPGFEGDLLKRLAVIIEEKRSGETSWLGYITAIEALEKEQNITDNREANIILKRIEAEKAAAKKEIGGKNAK